MPSVNEPMGRSSGPGGQFVTTQWSVIVAARGSDSPRAREALEALCRTYWYPVYALVRHSGHTPEDAQDLTQEFFARLLDRNYLSAVQRSKGKFRWFLRCAVKRFLLKERERAMARKRGGGLTFISIDVQRAEDRYRFELAEPKAPDCLFDRAWGIALIEKAHALLREEYVMEGKGDLYERLKVFISADSGDATYAALGRTLHMTDGALKVAVHRLRRRFRELLREQVVQTVQRPEDLDDELQHLRALFARG
ncbi:MAG TPA: sigma-70 family RNA polymerase sigma factor [Verrucomicrobiota bacterium]|nr:sigma-70 family RNA polymerase sigma factor [Verrucomicrobiota bacterium]HNU52727.1 sigma-70 family RNA polymerase sigma factor [Verrucomicrobiota bacterium]